jgi:excinuclease ABC subunit B
VPAETDGDVDLPPAEREKLIDELERAMREAARKFEFERAAQIRDRIKLLRTKDVAGIGIPG